MNRRDLLTLAPATLVGCAAPVQAGVLDFEQTPVMQAYREWRAYSTWVNGPATSGMDEDQIDALANKLCEYVARVVDATSQSHLDVVIKFLTVVRDYQFFNGIEELEVLETEACALVEAAA